MLFGSSVFVGNSKAATVRLSSIFSSTVNSSSELNCPLLPGCPGGLSVPLPPFLGMENVARKSDSPKIDLNISGLIEGTGKYAGMTLIPAGPYAMGSPERTGRVDERPVHDVFLNDFYVGKREVTVREFCRFLNNQGDSCSDGTSRIKLDDPTCPIVKDGALYSSKPGFSDKPVTHVSWYGAMDYAVWAGGRLPTSAEWEKAALYTSTNAPADVIAIPAEESIVSVNQASSGAVGVTGFAGNVWEWCHDWYQKDYYSQGAKTNPLGPPLGQEKIIRGGSWASPEASRRIRNRHKAVPRGFYRTVGFRIVKE